MSSNRSFRLLVVLVGLVLAVGVAGAVTVNVENTPDAVEVGNQTEATYVLSQLYQNPTYNQWTLRGETELSNVTWTIQTVNQAGTTVDSRSVDGQSFEQSVSLDSGAAEVRVRIVGTVPPIENYSYAPAETVTFAAFTQARNGGSSNEIDTFASHPYTNDTRTARLAIETANETIANTTGTDEAEETLQSAISAYNGGNFENAVTLAERAQREATQARQSQQRNQLLLFGAIAVILVALVVAGIWWYRRNQSASRL